MEILQWNKADFDKGLNIEVMSENESAKEIKITLAQGDSLDKHKAPSKISVQVLSGEIEFGVEDKIFILKALDCVYLDVGVLHCLKGLEDSIVRLIIYKNQ